MKKAILVIDMLKDFIYEDGALFCGEDAKRIIPYVKEKIEEFRKEGAKVIYLCDSHREDDLEFKRFRPHCIEGTKGSEVIDEISPKPSDVVIKKTRFSGFFRTDLDKVLKELGVSEIYVCGVCTSICVMETVSDLCDRDYTVYVFKDGVADFDKEAHNFALSRMEKILGAKVV